MKTLSVIMITKNAGDTLNSSLQSVAGLWKELIIGDDSSTDGTLRIAKFFGAKIVSSAGSNLGQRKQLLIERSRSDWILVLDSDEQLSNELRNEIKRLLTKASSAHLGYSIPYQNHIFGQPLYYGGEKYSKIRLFKRGTAKINPSLLHEEVDFDGTPGRLQGVILHNSYRSIDHVVKKFTKYATISSAQKDHAKEIVTLKKLFLYSPHMFWARYIKDQGWRDGWGGFVLALLFAYMEGLTYWLLLFRKVLHI